MTLGTIGVDQNGVTYTVAGIVHQRHLDELANARLIIEP